MNLPYPTNAQFFVGSIIEILNVDLVEPEIVHDWLFDFSRDDQIADINNLEKTQTEKMLID